MDDKLTGAEHKVLKFLLVATATTLIVNLLFLALPSSLTRIAYGTVQFLWPVISILVLLRIRSRAEERNTKFLSTFFIVALVPWAATLLLWEVLLPVFYNTGLAYYVSGFGFMACYGVLLLGLFILKRSRQWYIHRATDRLLSVIAAMGLAGVSAAVLMNMQWNSPRLLDIFIILSYLLIDILILIGCVKLLYMNLRNDLRYLVLIIAEFILINSFGDVIFELRWVSSVSSIFSIPVSRVTDIIYSVSLIFMVAALMLYDSDAKRRAMDEVNRTIHREKHLMDDVVMQSPDAMCVCDGGGSLTLVNDELFRLFGTRRSSMIREFNLFDHLLERDGSLAPQIAGLKAGQSAYLPDLFFGRNGRSYHLSVKIFPVSGPDGVITSYVCMINDITERLKAQKALEESKRQSELYVDLMAHDINNMNQIAMGFLEIAENTIMSEGKLEARHMGLLEKPIESMNNSSKLIENVKKLQKQKSGTLTVHETNLSEILRDVVRQFEDVPGRDVTLDYHQNGACPVMANDLLKEVFINLIGNAVKHSQGPVNICIFLSRIDRDGKGYCMVVIEDNGPGIPDFVKARIFSRFEPGKYPHGKGLGLYLARTLVDDHDGTISV